MICVILIAKKTYIVTVERSQAMFCWELNYLRKFIISLSLYLESNKYLRCKNVGNYGTQQICVWDAKKQTGKVWISTTVSIGKVYKKFSVVLVIMNKTAVFMIPHEKLWCSWWSILWWLWHSLCSIFMSKAKVWTLWLNELAFSWADWLTSYWRWRSFKMCLFCTKFRMSTKM